MNNKNMRKITIIVIPFFFFLMMGTVRSANLNFDAPIDLSYSIDGSTNVSRIRAFYENDSFFVGAYDRDLLTTDRKFSLSTWESTTFTTLLDGWDDYGSYFMWDMKPYNSTHGIVMFDLGFDSRNVSFMALDDLTLRTLSFDNTRIGAGGGANVSACGITNNGAVLQPQNTGEAVKYMNNSWANYTDLPMPSSYEDPYDFDLLYHDGNFHLLIQHWSSSGTSIYDLLYDENWGYIKTNAVADTETGNMSDPSWQVKAGTFYLTYLTHDYENFNETNATIRFRAFTWDSSQEKFYNIFSEEYTPPNVVHGFNYTSTAFLYYDDTNGHFWLFYSVYDKNDLSFLGMFAQSESGYCDCTAWENKTCISGTAYRERTRVCPFDCDDEGGSVWDSFCNDTMYYPDHTYPRTQIISDTGRCDTGWHDPADTPQIRCDASIEIPDTCININTSATFHNSVESSSTFWANLGDTQYSVTICNPLTSCNQYQNSWLCESQSNLTLTKDNQSYNAGETATGSMIVVGSPCQHRKNVLWEYGWKRYRVSGSITYFCNQYCGGDVCTTRGLVEYTIYQFPDCTYNESSKEICTYGCEDGVCKTSIPDTEIRQPIGNPFEWIKGEAEYNLGSTVTMVFAFGVSLAGGVYGAVSTKKWQIGAIAIMGLVALFMSIGWLPAIIGILWILSIALILAKGIFFKGT